MLSQGPKLITLSGLYCIRIIIYHKLSSYNSEQTYIDSSKNVISQLSIANETLFLMTFQNIGNVDIEYSPIR